MKTYLTLSTILWAATEFCCHGFTISSASPFNRQYSSSPVMMSTTPPTDSDNENALPESQRTTFDQAGASLIEEEDRKRMEEMGDFDSNPSYQDSSIEQMRAAIRERTANLGIEKSKVTAEYIESRQQAAMSGNRDEDSNTFGGIDLSKITSDGVSRGEWDEETPTMFYEPEAEMSVEEQQEVDPVMTKNPIEQALNELKNAKWPDFGAAGREVLLMGVVVAFSAALIIGSDTVLRAAYTSLGFIPTPEDMANYASRFDGLDLPAGWTDNMSENDVAELAGKVNTAITSSGLPEL